MSNTATAATASAPVSYDTHPERYKHWRLTVEGPVATLAMSVNENAGLREGYKLKLNSYDLGVDIELENNNLANLYVASYQLHSTLDFNESLKIILEIVMNLIGAEEFSITMLDEKTNELSIVAQEGMGPEARASIKLGEGIIGKAAKSGEAYYREGDPTNLKGVDYTHPLVCIPLKIKEHVIGVIAIYKLLVQKQAFSNVDYELFSMLAGHAATAIFSSKLYSQSERKLTTIQSFLDLLKEK